MKERIDVLLVQQGFYESREKARRAIMAGLVFRENERIDKPGTKIDVTTSLRVKGDPIPYVGRGGLKLEKALRVFPFSVAGKIMLDIGASTGGFTDCALQNGALRVYALDVGFNQLAWKLRNDERVVVMERVNFRYAELKDFTEGRPQIATADVSFISLKKILPPLKEILTPGGEVMVLVKPQFEAGKEEVGKKGIVRDQKVHQRVLEDMVTFCIAEGYAVKGLDYSPVTGGEGNIEFLAYLEWTGAVEKGQALLPPERITEVVSEAHSALLAKE
ncbi:putative rRNA methyltransferase YqxC [Pullulanibacillus camelliae]|uniref:Putative rRNA methyltransferase YqxC n=1 Tax=Pullulanibacillus camelliae TaxID=1707096 RepID=A0A8J2VT08_9BACL|nr:TlyA family RNA methyltransferase [Pullulanibacillus camelliae]GGE37577.1 putative rRNA methyltransferase YqxC [Pullulanibacillus camelliae]